ncbi:hypothetical protein [Actinotalea solisilvae]|uniref:hypothetical protein n=1 Tax=Actinotalea solisilvae TaxID=2072922 RepID=UPI001F35DA72|nr:hypothetical protein [Actinotalea solisilvae]
MVARPSPSCRRAGATPVWFERLAGDDLTIELEGWLRRGGPGAGPLPATLSDLRIQRDTTRPEPD